MKKYAQIYYWYGALALAYLLLTFLPAPSSATLTKYHLSALGLRLLDITLVLPILVMWFAIFYGYEKLRHYSQAITGSRDSKPITNLTQGLFVLAVGVPLASIISSTLALLARSHHSLDAAAAIIPNYISVLYPLIAFMFISVGTRKLSLIAKKRPSYVQANLVGLIVIILGVVFCDLIASSHHSIREAYHMSYSLVMLTLAIPYMYVWFLGFLSVVELYIYGTQVAGIVYRRSWRLLAMGLGSVIILDILLQYLDTMTSWLGDLSLSGLLLVLYVLLFALAASFILVAVGTQKLMKIEEA